MEETFSAAGRTIRIVPTSNGINVYLGFILVLTLTNGQVRELIDKLKKLIMYKETKPL